VGEPDRQVVIGRITGIFGVRGWVRVFSYTDPLANILRYGPWQLGAAGDSRAVLDGQLHGKGVVAQLAGISDRDQARALIGLEIRVPRERFPAAPADEYYWSDLIGLEVVTLAGEVLGQVTELQQTGAHDVLVVTGERRRLLPFVMGRVIRTVDLASGRIVVDWDAGF
jgi:16S rRNA processing protein RimM